jgi:hypothetical protein
MRVSKCIECTPDEERAVTAEIETIYVTSVEHFETPTAIGYKVEAQRIDTDPKIAYRLACRIAAGVLQAGRTYKLEPSFGNQGRYLVFPDVDVKDDKGQVKGKLVCTIESEK